MFKTYAELSNRRKIQDVHAKKSGASLFAKEFKEQHGREPTETECLLEIDRVQKLVDKRKIR